MSDNFEVKDALHDLKTDINKVAVTVDQIQNTLVRLENNITRLETTLSGQERRVIILEQTVPSTLQTDLALLKSSNQNLHKFLWVIATAAVTAWMKLIFDLVK
jgi:archaellum component FlaC